MNCDLFVKIEQNFIDGLLMKIEVRPLEASQHDLVCAIHNASFAYWIKKFGSLYGYHQVTPKEIADWVKSNADLEGTIWVAYLGGKPAGYACCQLELGQDHAKQVLFVETMEGLGQSKIAVIPEFKRKGIASALVKHALKFYARRGATKATIVAYSDNQVVSDFTRSLGFKKDNFFAVLGLLDLQRPIPSISQNPEVTVRKLESNDLEAITLIIHECRPDLRDNFATLEKVKTYYTRAEPWAEMSLVAEYRGKIVGLMEFTAQGLVGIAGVLPEFQKQGIGSTLFHHVLTTMQATGKKMALVDTGSIFPDAMRMYKRFGFDTSRQLWDWTKDL